MLWLSLFYHPQRTGQLIIKYNWSQLADSVLWRRWKCPLCIISPKEHSMECMCACDRLAPKFSPSLSLSFSSISLSFITRKWAYAFTAQRRRESKQLANRLIDRLIIRQSSSNITRKRLGRLRSKEDSVSVLSMSTQTETISMFCVYVCASFIYIQQVVDSLEKTLHRKSTCWVSTKELSERSMSFSSSLFGVCEIFPCFSSLNWLTTRRLLFI